MLNRLKVRSQLFEMPEEDVKKLFDELGGVAVIGKSRVSDRPLLLLQRYDEVHFKNTLYPLKQMLQREFNSVRVSWVPLWAPVDINRYPYGTVLARQADMANYPQVGAQEWFMTSRGVLQVNIGDLYRLYPNMTGDALLERFTAETDQIIRPLLPVRIVYDGQVLVLAVRVQDNAIDTISGIHRHVDITRSSLVPELSYRIGIHRIGSVRVGAPYEYQEPFFHHSTHVTAAYAHLYDTVPTRHGIDEIGEKRVGENKLPVDTRFKSITRTAN